MTTESVAPEMLHSWSLYLRASEEAFPDAVDVVIPFIRPDDHRSSSTIFSLADAPEVLFTSAPAKMLDLAAAIVGDAEPGSVYALSQVLDQIQVAESSLATTAKFQRLLRCATTP